MTKVKINTQLSRKAWAWIIAVATCVVVVTCLAAWYSVAMKPTVLCDLASDGTNDPCPSGGQKYYPKFPWEPDPTEEPSSGCAVKSSEVPTPTPHWVHSTICPTPK